MSTYNKVILEGRVGQAPKTNEAGTAATISLATDRNRKDKDGNWQNEVQWHRVVFFGKQAEYVAKNIKQGAAVRVEGEICYREYTDKENVKRAIAEINTDRVKITRQPASEKDAQASGSDAAEFDEANPQF